MVTKSFNYTAFTIIEQAVANQWLQECHTQLRRLSKMGF